MDVKLNGNETLLLEMSESGQLHVASTLHYNRATLFGDGLFETMIFSKGKIRYKKSHLSRIAKGCKSLQLKLDNFLILDQCETFINTSFPHLKEIRIRWNIYRDGLGKYTPETNKVCHQFILQIYHYTPPILKQAYINQSLNVPSLPWSNCKTLNALVYVMANLDRQKKKFDEVILLNNEGNICEAGAANLFWIKDSVYYTPSLRSNCIAGIGRKAIIKELKSRNIELVKGEFKPKEFLAADQVFTSNVTGLHYISQIDMREFDTTPIPFLEQLFYDK
ncbi:MAG TPA: aminotransferase class IV [Anditalea sp.]|nr:aminotransferase class IV [Anditalea sp.]